MLPSLKTQGYARLAGTDAPKLEKATFDKGASSASNPYLDVYAPVTEGSDQEERAVEIEQQNFLKTYHKWLLFFSLFLAITSSGTIFIMQTRLDSACLRIMDVWHPFLPKVTFRSYRFNWEACPQEFCGGVEDQREQAWENLWNYGYPAFPRQMMKELGKDPNGDWLRPLEPENADNLVSLPEFAHQTHCVALIRKTIYGERVLHNVSKEIEEARLWYHTNHCLLTLKIMSECKADPTPVIFKEAGPKSKVGAWTLIDAPRRCKNYESLRVALQDSKKMCSIRCNAAEIYASTNVEQFD